MIPFGFLTGCVTSRLPIDTTQCNLRTDINLGLETYLSQRYGADHPVRMAVIPFDVPETFASPGPESGNFGREIARKFISELHQTGTVPIIELFNRDRWPGKREEFYAGNYTAIQYARSAGYDLVTVGYLEDLKNDEDLDLLTKIIDTSNNVTIWSGRTRVTSYDRRARRTLAPSLLFDDRPDLFAFPERVDRLARCTTVGLMHMKETPQ